MKLPRELLDEIFSHLPKDDVETLRACSLAERSWVYSAQRLLFSSVEFSPRTHLLWGEIISPNNTELLDHVRSLHYFAPIPILPLRSNLRHIEDPIRHLPSFRQLQTLILYSMTLDPNICWAFQHTLSSLFISGIFLPWSAFIALIDYFPNLRNLGICNLHYDKGSLESIILSRPLCGGLTITDFATEALATFSTQLSRMQVAYDKLTIFDNRFPPSPAEYYQLIVNTCGKSLLYLKIQPHSDLDLSNCSELRQLVVSTDAPVEPQCAVIPSIASRNIRKIIFTGFHPDSMLYTPLDSAAMLPLERAMCGLVDKLRVLGYEHTLELEFVFSSRHFPHALASSRKWFLKFREKGRVIVSDTGSGKTIEVT